MPKYDIPTLWALLCGGKIKFEKKGRQEYLKCPQGACWSLMTKYNAVKLLLIHQCYKDLYTLWNGEGRQTEFIGGTSGIGKSTFIWYVLYRLMKAFHEDQAEDKELLKFLWVTQTEGIYLLRSDGNSAEVKHTGDSYVLQWSGDVMEGERRATLPSVDYCFIDMGRTFKVPMGLGNVCRRSQQTLITASTESARDGLESLEEHSIRPVRSRSMPIWSKEEMVAAAMPIFGESFKREKLHAIFLILGGSFELCLWVYITSTGEKRVVPMTSHYSKARSGFVELLKTSPSLVRAGVPKLVDDLLGDEVVSKVFESSSTDLHTMGNVITNNFCSGKYTDGDVFLSSPFISLYVESFIEANALKIEKFFSKIGGQPMLGGYLEHYGHLRLPKIIATPGKKWFRYLDGGPHTVSLTFSSLCPSAIVMDEGLCFLIQSTRSRQFHAVTMADLHLLISLSLTLSSNQTLWVVLLRLSTTL